MVDVVTQIQDNLQELGKRMANELHFLYDRSPFSEVGKLPRVGIPDSSMEARATLNVRHKKVSEYMVKLSINIDKLIDNLPENDEDISSGFDAIDPEYTSQLVDLEAQNRKATEDLTAAIEEAGTIHQSVFMCHFIPAEISIFSLHFIRGLGPLLKALTLSEALLTKMQSLHSEVCEGVLQHQLRSVLFDTKKQI